MTRIALALLVVVSQTACSVRPPASSPVPEPAPLRHVLSNGVRVIIQEDHASDLAALQLWVRAGGRDEAPRDLGLAHYLEHMLFKGTPSRPPGFVDREVEGVGGRMNASTSLDYTYYRMTVPAARAVGGVEMLADISVNALLDEQQLEREKRVVLEEMRRGDDSPLRLLSRKLYEAAFDGHPYGRAVIGSAELISALTREQLLTFYRRHYVPEAFTVVVVGAVNPLEILEAARRAFGRLPRGGTSRLPPPPVPELRSGRAELVRPGTYAHLGMAWPAPRRDHADTPAVDLLVSVLGQGRSSRLTRALRERLGLVNSISAGYSALEAAGLITITAQLDPANLPRVEGEILAELRRLRENGVRGPERERTVTVAEARREFEAETVEGRASVLGHAETVWRLEDERAWIDRLRAVTPLQLQVAARRYLDLERYVLVTLVPKAAP
ncbi:MAG: insulinase family protein [Candidatus Rokubacteria bacterium]|nr:insulinase family protein [Candidatus Rokubacteria bacterium]